MRWFRSHKVHAFIVSSSAIALVHCANAVDTGLSGTFDSNYEAGTYDLDSGSSSSYDYSEAGDDSSSSYYSYYQQSDSGYSTYDNDSGSSTPPPSPTPTNCGDLGCVLTCGPGCLLQGKRGDCYVNTSTGSCGCVCH